jgi:hypothetical protein
LKVLLHEALFGETTEFVKNRTVSFRLSTLGHKTVNRSLAANPVGRGLARVDQELVMCASRSKYLMRQ